MRSKRMELIAGLAKRDEDALAKTFQSAKIVVAQEQARLAELQNYYHSYSQMFAAKTTPLHAQDIMQSRNLLSRLADAQIAQEQQIILARQQLDHAQTQWQSSHLKRRSMEDLAQRCLVDEQQENDQKEQKQMDEWSSRPRLNR